MPSSYSFDVVSEFDQQELVNAIDQLRREVDQRYDLKDSKTKIDIKVLGYLIGEGKNQETPKLVYRENAVDVKIGRERVVRFKV